MTNVNAPFGLRPVRHSRGGVIRASEYTIADQYGTSLFTGDPVKETGTGKNIGIASAGASNKITGIFAGCEYVDALGETKFSKYWPASTVTKSGTTVKALVYDDPDIEFEVQFDTLAAADVRALANLASGAGNTVTGLSGWTGVAPPGSTENQVKIMDVPPVIGANGVTNAYGTYAVAAVLISQHVLGPALTSV